MGNNLDAFIARTKKYVDVAELTQTIVNEYIRKIVIHAPDKSAASAGRRLRFSSTSWMMWRSPYWQNP